MAGEEREAAVEVSEMSGGRGAGMQLQREEGEEEEEVGGGGQQADKGHQEVKSSWI